MAVPCDITVAPDGATTYPNNVAASETAARRFAPVKPGSETAPAWD
jgi:hypothetical protein